MVKNTKTIKKKMILIQTFLNNKAGYMTNTSCGWVCRGGNARFHTFLLVLTDQQIDGRTDRQMDGRTDKASYRVACPQIKMITYVHLCSTTYVFVLFHFVHLYDFLVQNFKCGLVFMISSVLVIKKKYYKFYEIVYYSL